MKRFVISMLVLSVVLLAGCTSRQEAPAAAIPNPWKTWDTLQEAQTAAGFSLGLPERIGDSFTADAFRTLEGEEPLLEIIYTDDACSVTVRKASGEGKDISGVYGHDSRETRQWEGEKTVTFCTPKEGDSLLVLLDSEGCSWSLYAPEGFPGDSCEDFLRAIFA